MQEDYSEIKNQINEVIEAGICEPSRLYHMLDMIEKQKPLYKSDVLFLEKMKDKLDEKAALLEEENKEIHYALQKPEKTIGLGRIVKTQTLVDDQRIDELIASHNLKQHDKNNKAKNDVFGN